LSKQSQEAGSEMIVISADDLKIAVELQPVLLSSQATAGTAQQYSTPAHTGSLIHKKKSTKENVHLTRWRLT
jgi:hypothetical protein